MSDIGQRMEQMTAALRARGCRLTPQRMAILELLAESKNHPSVEMIYEEIKKEFPTTSLATVYKTITLLKDLREVLELGFADGGARYDGNIPFPHPHVICTKCGAIVDPHFKDMEKIAAEMAENSGFSITHHRLDFFGLCPKCQAKE